MIAFIDERGDTGFKFESGSSKYFTVGIVYFDQDSEAQACDQRIELLKKELRVKKEFKFTSMKREGREAFLRSMIPYSFYYVGISIDKTQLVQADSYAAQINFYKYAASLIIELATPYLSKAIIVIDGEGSREFRSELKKYLKEKSKLVVHSLKFQDSHRNNLLQLADMIAGSLDRTLSDKSDSKIYRSIIKQKEIAFKIYPPQDFTN